MSTTKFNNCEQHKNLALQNRIKDLMTELQFCNSCGCFYKLPTPAKPFGDGVKPKVQLVKILKAEHAALVAVAEAANNMSASYQIGSRASKHIGLTTEDYRRQLDCALANLAAVRGQNGGAK